MAYTGILGTFKKMKGYRYIFRHICTSSKNNKHLKFSLCKNGKTDLTRRFTLETYNLLWTYKKDKDELCLINVFHKQHEVYEFFIGFWN